MKSSARIAGYWAQSADALFDALDSRAGGLSASEAEERLRRHGLNALSEHERLNALALLFNQFRNPLVLILAFAAIVSAIVHEWVDATVVIAIVIGSALLSFVQEYSAGHAVARLRARVALKATVLRDGAPQSVPAERIVPGDVVLLSAGSLIPADGVVLEAKDFFVNQAALTGETFPAEKTAAPSAPGATLAGRTNVVFTGTSVRSGTARVLTVATGAASEYGAIAARLSLRPPETEFERGIRQFGYLLTRVILVLVLVVFAINLIFEKPPIDSLLFAIALAVGMAPELLPAIVSINLSKGARAMAEHGVIVRRLNAIENFGSMDVLCTDKTGTLTAGVVRLDGALDRQFEPSDAVFRAAYLNAHFQTGLSNPLDQAILSARDLPLEGVQKLDEVPYDFTRKRLSVAVREGDAPPRLITKGALDGVLAICALDDAERARIQAQFERWSTDGYRVLGVATKALAPAPAYGRDDERAMDFAGFLLFFDPPKPEAIQAIADLSRMGVQLKIISGDNRWVTAHVARIVGLPSGAALTGAELNLLSDEALWHAAERTTLFAEVDPAQKERLIGALRKTGHVVGYMGDGINDAPALHAADVGVSVENAVDVAKEAADFVLLRHDLDVLRQGIAEGRRTFANTLKYIFTTTSANFGNMFSMAGASLFLPFLPLLATQILLNNFLSDFPAATIAGDRVDPDWVERPRRWDIRFVRNFMVVFGLVSSVFDYLTFAVLMFVVRAAPEMFRTAWFVESLLTELFVALVVRTRLPFYRSRPGNWLLLSTLLVAALAMVLPYSPLAAAFEFVPMPPELLLLIVAITGLYLLAAEAAKRVVYRGAA